MPIPIFPCAAVPEEPKLARLLGLYPQRQEGLWMQRVKVPGGRLPPRQWKGLARIASELTPGTPLHLTTRQDLEFHNVTAEAAPVLQRRLAEADLTGLGACGDTIRNVTVCPCSGAKSGSVDLMPAAVMIRRVLESGDDIYDLPRKFKIALSCGPDCGQPWINDLAFVARAGDGRPTFTVIAAGSLGPKPGCGMVLVDRVECDEILPLARATVAVFGAHGDRDNRRRARLRYVRERIGDAVMVGLIQEAFDRAKAQRDWPDLTLTRAPEGFSRAVTLTFPNGDLALEAVDALGDLAGRDDVLVRIDTYHRVILFGRSESSLRSLAETGDALRDAAKPQASVVACPGRRWCKLALTDSNAMADRIRRECAGLPTDWVLAVSGCPNGCAHSTVADIGLTGAVITQDHRKTDAYNVTAHGGRGKNDRLGRPVDSKITPDDVIRRVRDIAGG